jgi:hypothetical protein
MLRGDQESKYEPHRCLWLKSFGILYNIHSCISSTEEEESVTFVLFKIDSLRGLFVLVFLSVMKAGERSELTGLFFPIPNSQFPIPNSQFPINSDRI